MTDLNGQDGTSEHFKIKKDMLALVLNSIKDRDLTLKVSKLSEEGEKSYRFVDYMVRKVRTGKLTAEDKAAIVELDFKMNGVPIAEVLEPSASQRSVEGMILSYAKRRAIATLEEAVKIEQNALEVIVHAKAKIKAAQEEAEAIEKEMRERIAQAKKKAAEAEAFAEDTMREIVAGIKEINLERMKSVKGEYTYLDTEELAARLKYDARTVREHFTKSMVEGVHYTRGPGGRKILWIWETIESDMLNGVFATMSESN